MSHELVVVTGAGGFIGGHLAHNLAEEGFRVRAVDLKPIDEWHQVVINAESLVLDLRSPEACDQAVNGAAAVYNLAADMGGMGFIEQNKARCMLSVLINTQLLQSALRAEVERFFFASSACVYAQEKQLTPEIAPLKERDAYPADPEDGYGWEKLFSERMCRHFHEDFGLTTRVARFHNVYGPYGTWAGGREKAPAAICRKLAEAQLSGEHGIEIWGDGEQTRSFTFIDDCIAGIRKIMDSDIEEPLNLGSSEMVTINQLVDMVEEIAGINVVRRYVLDAPKGVRGRNSDNTVILERLGWEPRTSLRAGLSPTYRWVFDQVLKQELVAPAPRRDTHDAPATPRPRPRAASAPEQEPLRIQLWSYNFAPEPTGIGIVSTVWARGLRDLGHQVEVVAAHPHYPEPRWGRRLAPYRERREGVDVLRLPLWIGRASAAERYRQELTFMMAQALATPLLSSPEVLVSTSPCFPALLPAVANVRARRVPWVLWLHDLLPDGAAATGLCEEEGSVIKLARRLERLAYRTADRIVVLSRAFTDNLVGKGVPADKIELIYDPATRVPQRLAAPGARGTPLRVLSMGNIGYSQGLTALVRAFEAHPDPGARLVITGTGVCAEEVRAEIRSDRVRMLGMVDDRRLEEELQAADVALVTQRHDGSEFNIPSKLMNFMAYGLPVLAAVNPGGEVARLVREAGAGWVVDSSDPGALPHELAHIAHGAGTMRERSAAALRWAHEQFTQEAFADRFEQALRAVVRRQPRPSPVTPPRLRLPRVVARPAPSAVAVSGRSTVTSRPRIGSRA